MAGLVRDQIFNTFEDRVSRLSLCTRSPDAPEKQAFHGNAFNVYCELGTCLMLTCNHCLEKGELEDNQSYRVDFSKSCIPGFEVKVAYRDVDRDLALLRVDGLLQDLDYLNFADIDDVTAGTNVVLLAFYTMHGSVLDEPGTMSGNIVGLPDTSKPCQLIRSNYTSKPGASGSPVVMEKQMAVVGVHCEGEFAAKYAISIQCIKAALRDWSGSEENSSIFFMLEAIARNG